MIMGTKSKMVLFVAQILLGFIQFLAMVGGFVDKLGKLLGIATSLLLGQVPIVGTVFGVTGAMHNWGFSLLQALLLFAAGPILYLVYALVFRD